MQQFNMSTVISGMIGFITGGFAWIKSLWIGDEALRYFWALFVAGSVAFMGVVGKEVGQIALRRLKTWYKSGKKSKQ